MRALVGRQYVSSKTYILQDDAKYARLAAFGEMSQVERDGYELVMGHQAIRLANQLSAPRVITFLRNPVKRVVSLYHYVREVRPEHPWHRTTKLLSIEQLYAEGIHEQWSELTDGQCRSLMSWKMFAHMKEQLSWNALLERLALDHGASFVVGLTERFDESLLVMKRRLGWARYPYYERKNTNTRKQLLKSTSDADLQAIASHNETDGELYRAAVIVMEKILEHERQLGFDAELAYFRRRNEVLGRVEAARGTLAKIYRRVAGPRN